MATAPDRLSSRVWTRRADRWSSSGGRLEPQGQREAGRALGRAVGRVVQLPPRWGDQRGMVMERGRGAGLATGGEGYAGTRLRNSNTVSRGAKGKQGKEGAELRKKEQLSAPSHPQQGSWCWCAPCWCGAARLAAASPRRFPQGGCICGSSAFAKPNLFELECFVPGTS